MTLTKPNVQVPKKESFLSPCSAHGNKVWVSVVLLVITFCLRIFFCSAISTTRFSLAMATSWVSVLSGGESGVSESFSLSSLLKLSFLCSPRHFLWCLLRSCSQLKRNKNTPQIRNRLGCHSVGTEFVSSSDIEKTTPLTVMLFEFQWGKQQNRQLDIQINVTAIVVKTWPKKPNDQKF